MLLRRFGGVQALGPHPPPRPRVVADGEGVDYPRLRRCHSQQLVCACIQRILADRAARKGGWGRQPCPSPETPWHSNHARGFMGPIMRPRADLPAPGGAVRVLHHMHPSPEPTAPLPSLALEAFAAPHSFLHLPVRVAASDTLHLHRATVLFLLPCTHHLSPLRLLPHALLSLKCSCHFSAASEPHSAATRSQPRALVQQW